MMTLLMLPFLLAIRTSINNDGSRHIPVYTYTAQVSCYSLNSTTNLKTKPFHMTSTLKCHPRLPTVLNCRVDSAIVRSQNRALLDLGETSMDTWELGMEPFEIHFDRKGVVMVHVDESMPTWMIGIIKPIVDQLNIGFDLRTQPYIGTFETKERSYIGNCQTIITINQRLNHMKHVWPDISAYTIISVRNKGIDNDEILEIVKERNLKHCSIDYDPVIHRKTASSTIYKNVPTRMTTSMSRILISDTNYTSFTANDLLAKNLITGETVQLFEEITLVLDSVTTKSIDSSQNHRSEEKSSDPRDEQDADSDTMAQAA